MSQKRLQTVHLAWLALVAGSTLAGMIAGTPPGAALLAGAAAALPGIVGALLPAGSVTGRGLLVLTWNVLAISGLIVSGAAASPLTIWLAVAPVTALLTGQRRMAAEAGIFGCAVLVMVLMADTAGWLEPPPVQAGLLTGLYAFAGLVLVVLMISLLVAEGAGRDDKQVAGISGQPPGSGEGASPAQPAGPPLPRLPSAQVALIESTPQGRLRAVAGDRFGLKKMRAGALLSDLFEAGSLPEGLSRPGWVGKAEARLSCGQDVLIVGETGAEGTSLLILKAPVAPHAALEAVQAEFEARLRQRTAFFASLGHELRTPLHAILGYAELMQAELMGPLPEAYQDYPAIIHESGTDLLLLVDDILDLARSEAGEPRLDPEPVDLTASAESVVRQMSAHALRASVTLKIKAEGQVWAQADARAVRQTWQNLVSNAIKYSPAGKVVTLETRIVDTMAVMSVQDRGRGIDTQDLSRLTQPFVQAVGSRPGTGLGLSVVRRFAELQGGEFRLVSSPGRGTKAQVMLPLADAADLVSLDAGDGSAA